MNPFELADRMRTVCPVPCGVDIFLRKDANDIVLRWIVDDGKYGYMTAISRAEVFDARTNVLDRHLAQAQEVLTKMVGIVNDQKNNSGSANHRNNVVEFRGPFGIDKKPR